MFKKNKNINNTKEIMNDETIASCMYKDIIITLKLSYYQVLFINKVLKIFSDSNHSLDYSFLENTFAVLINDYKLIKNVVNPSIKPILKKWLLYSNPFIHIIAYNIDIKAICDDDFLFYCDSIMAHTKQYVESYNNYSDIKDENKLIQETINETEKFIKENE